MKGLFILNYLNQKWLINLSKIKAIKPYLNGTALIYSFKTRDDYSANYTLPQSYKEYLFLSDIPINEFLRQIEDFVNGKI